MSGRIFGDSKNATMLLKNLMDSVKEVQNVYGKNKTLLATEKDGRVQRMCTNWESALSHGLKTVSVFKNIVSGNLTAELSTNSFWDFAFNHLTTHEKERFSTLRHVHTDHGKLRALIRAALNERALERYILTWLGDVNGLNTFYESWALIRDNEASNLMPSIAAGLSAILFAITVDCPELNLAPVAEPISSRQTNEIIIAVPTVSSTSERKSNENRSKRAAPIISFEEDDASVINNNVWQSSTPPTSVSLADACLKYQERRKLAEEKSKPFASDSTYERLHAEPINVAPSSSRSSRIEYVEEESPTAITIINPVTETYHSSFPSFSNSYDYKETDSSMSKATDSSSITSNTTHSSNSPPNQQISHSSHSSHSLSMSSSVSSVHNSADAANSPLENEYISRIEEMKVTETENVHRIQQLEKRCASLEERESELSLENARLKTIHHNLVMSRHSSRHFFVSIPRVSLQRREDSNRKYFAYEIKITPASGEENESWSLLRRYSEFHRLDRYLQKSNPMIKTLDFPPKKSFGNINAEFVEMRRQRLQVYLLGVLSLMPEISKCTTRSQLEHAFPFFKQCHQL